jgi:hypothetical protein
MGIACMSVGIITFVRVGQATAWFVTRVGPGYGLVRMTVFVSGASCGIGV